jgi:hypothetical protein
MALGVVKIVCYIVEPLDGGAINLGKNTINLRTPKKTKKEDPQTQSAQVCGILFQKVILFLVRCSLKTVKISFSHAFDERTCFFWVKPLFNFHFRSFCFASSK